MSVDVQPGGQPPITTERFKKAMRHLAGTACVITVVHNGVRSGLTASSVVSVAADPAEVLVAVDMSSSSWPLLEAGRRFGVNILAAAQYPLAMQFAGVNGCQGEDRYAGYDWQETADGVWLLRDAPSALACEATDMWVRHSHALVIGRVTAIQIGTEPVPSPLLYWQAHYGRFETMRVA